MTANDIVVLHTMAEKEKEKVYIIRANNITANHLIFMNIYRILNNLNVLNTLWLTSILVVRRRTQLVNVSKQAMNLSF